MSLLPDDFSAALEQVPARAFSNWVTGDRASDECEQLRALAETITVDELSRLHGALSQLAQAGEATWRDLDAAGVHKDSFLALQVALMASSDSDCAGTAAAAYMAGVRCSGAAAHGVLHPMAAFELSKALRTVLCSTGPSSRAANPKAAAPGRKRAKPDASDDWDEDRPRASAAWAAEATCATRALVASELSLLLQSVPLRAHPDVLASLVSALVAVATTDLATPKAGSKARASADPAPSRHFDALALCLRAEHGDAAQTAPLIFRALVPHMALVNAPASPTVPKDLLAAQAACTYFVLLVAATGGDSEEAKSLLHSVQALLQRVSVAAPERAEARAQVCSALSRLVLALPGSVAARYAQFLWRYGHTAKIGARTFATEMSASMLQLAASSAEAQAVLLAAEDAPQTCWRLVLQRLSDKAAGARTKALGCLASLLEALHALGAAPLLHMVQQPLLLSAVSPSSGATPHLPTPHGNTDRRLSLLSSTDASPASRDVPGSRASPGTPGVISPSASLVSEAKLEASLNGLGARLQQRCADERPAVRRVALLALEAWGVCTGSGLSRSQMAAIASRCEDSSASIRKQAARSLTALLRLDPISASTRAAWIDGVLPLARDSEATVSDAAIEAIEEMLVEPLSACAVAPRQPPADSFWMLLAAIRPPSLPHVQHAVGTLSARSRLPAKLAPAAQALLAQEAPPRGDGRAGRDTLWAILLQVAMRRLPAACAMSPISGLLVFLPAAPVACPHLSSPSLPSPPHTPSPHFDPALTRALVHPPTGCPDSTQGWQQGAGRQRRSAHCLTTHPSLIERQAPPFHSLTTRPSLSYTPSISHHPPLLHHRLPRRRPRLVARSLSTRLRCSTAGAPPHAAAPLTQPTRPAPCGSSSAWRAAAGCRPRRQPGSVKSCYTR
jgi:hypothetical protein